VAVAAFLQGAMPFGRISETIERTLEAHTATPASSVAAVRAADRWAREKALESVRQ
jgi:1-deoxy-D-xylulose 5-phosphate reductoisomerase